MHRNDTGPTCTILSLPSAAQLLQFRGCSNYTPAIFWPCITCPTRFGVRSGTVLRISQLKPMLRSVSGNYSLYWTDDISTDAANFQTLHTRSAIGYCLPPPWFARVTGYIKCNLAWREFHLQHVHSNVKNVL